MHFKILNAFNVTVPWRVLRKLVLLSLHPTSLSLPPMTWSSCCERSSAQHCALSLSLKWHIALSKQSPVQESLAFTVITTNHKMFKLFRHLVVYIFKFLLVFLVVLFYEATSIDKMTKPSPLAAVSCSSVTGNWLKESALFAVWQVFWIYCLRTVQRTLFLIIYPRNGTWLWDEMPEWFWLIISWEEQRELLEFNTREWRMVPSRKVCLFLST